MSLNIVRKHKAQELLNDAEFRRKWADLYKKCPWGTVFQDVQYLSIWNKNYKDVCELVFVYEQDESGELTGLFPLSSCLTTDKVFIAGDYHSEYQTWLATPENGNEFATKALDLLKLEFPKKKLQMMFLAPDTPLEWLDGHWAKQTILQTVPRPLIDLSDKEKSAKSLRKRGNKSRIRQLKKKGDLEFKELNCSKKFGEMFDEIEDFSRLRLSAIHNVQPETDKNRKQFHIDLMKVTDIICPSLLTVDENIASAQVCFRNRDEMLLSITSMSPFYAKQSPSKIHLLMLGDKLTKTNYKNFDLSPGNGYKQRFATKTEESHTLTIFFNKGEFSRHKAKRKVIDVGRKALEKLNVTRSAAFKIADKFRHKLKRVKVSTIPGTILKHLKRKIYEHKECRMYSFDVEKIKTLPNPNLMKKNSVSDLLKFRPVEGWQETTSQFHQKVLHNYESGTHSYSTSDSDTLLHYGWLLERQKTSNVYEVDQKFNLPPDTAVLFDYYTHPKARGKGLYNNSILQGLHDASKIPETKQVYIGVMADNTPSRHVIEKLGFKHEGSLFKETRFGVAKKWQVWDKVSEIKEKDVILKESYST